MKFFPHFCFAAVLALPGLCLSVHADDVIRAQPITLSALVGNEQSDFFFTSNFLKDYVVFTGAIPQRGGLQEIRALFSVKIREITSSTVLTYSVVGKPSPLKKLASFKVPVGTVFDTFLKSDNTASSSYVRQVFRVPGFGLYMTTNGAAPRLFYAEKATAPITGATLRHADNQPNDSDRAQQFRVVFGATDPKKGSEPFQSTGVKPTSKLLKDIVPAAPGSNPAQFTTFEREAYFVATNPVAQTRDIYKCSVSTANPSLPVYTAVNVTNGLVDAPQQLTGSGAGLFYTSTPAGGTQSLLYRSGDGVTFEPVLTNDAAPVQVTNATQLTPSINPMAGDFAFSAFDNVTGTTRLAVYDTFNNIAKYPEIANATSVLTTNPTHITSTGNYYYFGATYDGFSDPYVVRNFTGSSDVEYITAGPTTNYITNLQEIVDVADSQFDGTLYFTADATVDGVFHTGILFSMGPNSPDPVATPVRTIGNALVEGAHNLRAVKSGQIFRLYFTAPVNGTTNSEYAAGGTDYGTKPWVVNVD